MINTLNVSFKLTFKVFYHKRGTYSLGFIAVSGDDGDHMTGGLRYWQYYKKYFSFPY